MTFALATVTLNFKCDGFCVLKLCPAYISESVSCRKLILGRDIALLPCDVCVTYNEIGYQLINSIFFHNMLW